MDVLRDARGRRARGLGRHSRRAGLESEAISISSTNFSGSIPRLYDEVLGPLLFDPYAADLARRVPVSDAARVLEVACGTGIVTRRLRAALPASATLVATDLNEAMVEYAREAVALPGIAWQTADAQALPFPDESFDVVVCQFGIMFLPDTARGFGEAWRVLAPGGTFLANAWHSLAGNPADDAIAKGLAALFPDDPPRFLDTPHAYTDRDRMRADAAAGGFADVHLDDVHLQTRASSAFEYVRGMVQGTPLSHEIRARGADLDGVTRAIAETVAPGSSAPYTVELGATVITAVRAA